MPHVLIVGGGIAGTLMAWQLQKRGCTFHLIDNANPFSASRAAGAMLSPIGGRLMAPAHRLDEYWPAALETYLEIGKALEKQIYSEITIYQPLTDDTARRLQHTLSNNLYAREFYLGPVHSLPEGYIPTPHHTIAKIRGGRVDGNTLLDSLRVRWMIDKTMDLEHWEEADLELNGTSPRYRGKEYGMVILAQGWRGKDSALFPSLPINAVHGEAMVLKGLKMPEAIVKKHEYALTLADGNIYIGSTYNRDPTTERATEEGMQKLGNAVATLIEGTQFNAHMRSGIRPTTPDRRPIRLTSPLHPRVHCINGWGTKGYLIGPLEVQQAADEWLAGRG